MSASQAPGGPETPVFSGRAVRRQQGSPGGEPAGRVEAIFLAPEAGAPLRPVESVATMGLEGLDGDRYARGRGYWSGSGHRCEPVTVVAAEDLEEASRRLGRVLDGQTVRRNVVTRGVSMSELLGVRFRIGDVVLEGIRPCEPCRYLERLTGAPGLRTALQGRGGVRAALRSPGTISVGDVVTSITTTNIVDTGATTA